MSLLSMGTTELVEGCCACAIRGFGATWRGTACNNRVSAPPYAALRFATVLGPCTLTESFRFAPFFPFVRARAGFGIFKVRAPHRAADKLRFAQLRLLEHVI